MTWGPPSTELTLKPKSWFNSIIFQRQHGAKLHQSISSHNAYDYVCNYMVISCRFSEEDLGANIELTPPLRPDSTGVSHWIDRFCPQRDVTILGGGDRDWLIEYQWNVMEDVDLAGLELSIPGLRGKFLLRCIVCFYMLLAWIMYTLKPIYQKV